VTKNGKMLERRLHILGNGSTLAFVDVNHGVSEQVEAWFRKHKLFHGNVARSAPTPSAPPRAPVPNQSMVADELRNLADLRNEGILSDEEFQAQKAKLLAH
jgi:Short C-terminal domain